MTDTEISAQAGRHNAEKNQKAADVFQGEARVADDVERRGSRGVGRCLANRRVERIATMQKWLFFADRLYVIDVALGIYDVNVAGKGQSLVRTRTSLLLKIY